MDRYADRQRYFLELAETSRNWYLDYVGRFLEISPAVRVLEIGCGEGGNLLPFAELGCQVAGIDLAVNKIANARTFFAQRNVPGEFFHGDFLTFDALDGLGRFDLVLVHDVIEHIAPGSKPAFLAGIRRFLKPGGIVFFGFPAWRMPFGGHQQICRKKPCRLPFIHLLPSSMYRAWLEMFSEEQFRIDELMEIREARMTPGTFEALCREGGYAILDRTLWLISPHYKAKFGLRPARLVKPFSVIPWLRDFMATSCFYILSDKKR